MTTFNDWIQRNGLKKSYVAASIGVANSKLTRILKGEQMPDLDEAHAIEKLTQGHIKMKDWVIPK